MKEKNLKIILLSIAMVLMASLIPYVSFATQNDEVILLQKGENEYFIYSKGLLDKEFEFAFSDKADETDENLNFISSAKDNSSEGANNVAYINETIYTNYLNGKTSTNLYIKYLNEESNYIKKTYEIVLTNAITMAQLEVVNKTTHRIEVNTKATIVTESIEDGIKTTVTKGAVEIDPEGKNPASTYKYQIITLPMNADYTRFMELANKISKFNENTDMYTKLSLSKEFYDLYTQLKPTSGWLDVKNNVITQPSDSKQDEQYIVWIKQNDGTVDVQFLKSYEEHKEEKVTEEVIIKETSKLPVTYDNITLFIVLAVIIVAIVLVLVVRTVVSKKSKKED